jgi:phosphatidylserine decarboxylase
LTLFLVRFVAAIFGRLRFTTPVAKKTLSPTYPALDATFDFPIYLSQADNLGGLELVVWDKDLIKKDYLGEASLSLDEWFKNGETGDGLAFDHEHNYVGAIC